MAIARCAICGVKRHTKVHYVITRSPMSHPHSGVVCGNSVCDRPALIWLTAPEEARYQVGERIFLIRNDVVKVRLQ